MMTMSTTQLQAQYRICLQQFLEEAPGGRFYNQDQFDLTAYKERCGSLKGHKAAGLTLAGIPSKAEPSWLWDDGYLQMYLLSPINVTRLRDQAEQYERRVEPVSIKQFELAL